jgi:cation transporter-like permease
MKNKDRIKEEIGFEKLLMTITSAISISLIGWLFQNVGNSGLITTILVAGGILFSLTATVFFFLSIDIKIKELDHEH